MDAKSALTNSIRNLANLYTIVIGIALTLAVSVVIDPKDGLRSITLVSALLFVAFVLTLLPFFHGALRHLDDVYIENDSSHIRVGVVIVDFSLLFLHALAFLILAELLRRPADFIWFLTCLLTIDVLWGFSAYAGFSSKKAAPAESRWAIINLVFVAIAALYLISNDIFPITYTGNEPKLASLVAIACLLRSVVDYIWCKSFYFPSTTS